MLYRDVVEAERRAGLPAQVLAPDELPASVAAFVDADRVLAAGSFRTDGVASPRVLVGALRAQATARGARFLAGRAVVGLEPRGGHLVVTTERGDRLKADDVVLAGGGARPDCLDRY